MPDLDQFESELRDQYPRPSEQATTRARAAILAATAPKRTKPRRRSSRIAAVAAAAAALAAAFAVGYAVAATRSTPATLQAPGASGPGFLPSSGWNILQNGLTTPPLASVATAANVQFARGDAGQPTPMPARTVAALPADGIVIWAIFYPRGQSAGIDRKFPARSLPLRVAEMIKTNPPEGFNCPPRAQAGCFDAAGAIRRLQTSANGYDIALTIFFGRSHPSAATIAAANQELAQLSLPGCPTAVPLQERDLQAAAAFTLSWLRAHYIGPGHLRDLRGARAVGFALPAHPADSRLSIVRTLCGSATDRIVAVRVTPSRVGRQNLGPKLLYFLAKTPAGWAVWRQG
jgi:hypothetical protein